MRSMLERNGMDLFVLQEGELLDEHKGGALNCTSLAPTKLNYKLHSAGDKVRWMCELPRYLFFF